MALVGNTKMCVTLVSRGVTNGKLELMRSSVVQTSWGHTRKVDWGSMETRQAETSEGRSCWAELQLPPLAPPPPPACNFVQSRQFSRKRAVVRARFFFPRRPFQAAEGRQSGEVKRFRAGMKEELMKSEESSYAGDGKDGNNFLQTRLKLETQKYLKG